MMRRREYRHAPERLGRRQIAMTIIAEKWSGRVENAIVAGSIQPGQRVDQAARILGNTAIAVAVEPGVQCNSHPASISALRADPKPDGLPPVALGCGMFS